LAAQPVLARGTSRSTREPHEAVAATLRDGAGDRSCFCRGLRHRRDDDAVAFDVHLAVGESMPAVLLLLLMMMTTP
jgi:hypothetical protein